jgi:hypothetical protein
MQNQHVSTIHGHPQEENFKHQNTQRVNGDISTVLYHYLHCTVFHQYLVIVILNIKATENVTKVQVQTSN